MTTRLGKSLIWLSGLGLILWVIGLAAAKAFERDAIEEAEEFRVAAFWGRRTYRNSSPCLCSGVAVAALGGVVLDLGRARLHPGGAELSLRVYAGDIQVRVPSTWRVELHKDVKGGDVKLHLADDAPEGAPLLEVDALIVAGALEISSET
jgi:predicted membrane protein